ncbi:hypothetical protein E4K72_08835 [Oxalobacteraceae bacterium OM1]|nr:hypothetical protein E4K72_08835 [Oxalobacteraceae bacterium OM1]
MASTCPSQRIACSRLSPQNSSAGWSDEQTAGIEQVNAAVTQMDDSTQQNAALVEESAAAARQLQDQAHQLAQLVAVFNLGAAGALPGATAAPTAAATVAAPARHTAALNPAPRLPSAGATPRRLASVRKSR